MTSVLMRESSTAATPGFCLQRRPDGQLWLVRDGDARAVTVQRSFPWSEPTRFVSLRDGEVEVAFVSEPADLEAASRRVLEDALVEAGFVLQVRHVCEVEEEVEIRRWRVETAQGPRHFATRLDDWPRPLPGGGFLLRDVANDLYHIPEPGRLDRKSRELLWAFVD